MLQPIVELLPNAMSNYITDINRLPLCGSLLPRGDILITSTYLQWEPSCYHAATSERRHIRLKADYYYIALRGASIRRSQRGNSEAVFFCWILPRRQCISLNCVVIASRHINIALWHLCLATAVTSIPKTSFCKNPIAETTLKQAFGCFPLLFE